VCRNIARTLSAFPHRASQSVCFAARLGRKGPGSGRATTQGLLCPSAGHSGVLCSAADVLASSTSVLSSPPSPLSRPSRGAIRDGVRESEMGALGLGETRGWAACDLPEPEELIGNSCRQPCPPFRSPHLSSPPPPLSRAGTQTLHDLASRLLLPPPPPPPPHRPACPRCPPATHPTRSTPSSGRRSTRLPRKR
jgi:hypothetical protein